LNGRWRLTGLIVSMLALAGGAILGRQSTPAVTLTGMVSITRGNVGGGKIDISNAVVWLKPMGGAYRPGSGNGSASRPHFKMLQEHKRFEPHVLAVPVGSVIDFPNLDPFLHNVFSMFEGKRFDLGLYEAGTSHSVTFDSPGICYIFCNIHPEMSAAVVVIDSPYHATTNRAGQFSIANVVPGNYILNVWHERGKPEKPTDYPRAITILPETTSLGTIHLIDAGELLANHKNKYGHDYEPPANPIYK
jgi:plastocyanin